jgi:hypothetical protein
VRSESGGGLPQAPLIGIIAPHFPNRSETVAKERNTVKEGKKKPLLTPKERKEQKQAKKAERQARR